MSSRLATHSFEMVSYVGLVYNLAGLHVIGCCLLSVFCRYGTFPCCPVDKITTFSFCRSKHVIKYYFVCCLCVCSIDPDV